MTKLSKKEIDEVFPPFSNVRRQLREEWEDLGIYCNWEEYLETKALEILERE